MKPYVQIIPGSFSLESFYYGIRDAVIALGYESSITPLQSSGKRNGQPPATKEDDVRHIRSVTESLLEKGKEVVLVMHSYGGIPGTESVKGLLKGDREKAGKTGGVVRLIYMTAVAPEAGQSLNEIMAPLMAKYVGINYVKLEGDYMFHEPALSAKFTFSDLPDEEGLKLAQSMPHHSAISFNGKLSYAAYKDLPVSYILCTQDCCVPPDLQRSMIASIERESGRKVHVQELESGHCPNASRPAEAAKFIATAVEQAA
ncbi:hypothetical protein SLS56_009758 [Neofusicoccum ribis]|uniref:AB hydrolase-1 domain-containing protein n=1 Tax=Neofusicoccum ribis TaxID=45134 RepID=A0ABR3SGC6_9PEZI